MFKPLFKSDTDVGPLCQVILIWGLFLGKLKGKWKQDPLGGLGEMDRLSLWVPGTQAAWMHAVNCPWRLVSPACWRQAPSVSPYWPCFFLFPRTHLDGDLNKFTRKLASPHHQGIYVLFQVYDLPCRTRHISPLVIAFHHVALSGIQHRARLFLCLRVDSPKRNPPTLWVGM